MDDRIAVADLARNFRPARRVRFNAEDFGFIIGFPDGEVELLAPEAIAVLREDVTQAETAPYLLETLPAPKGFHLRTPVLAWIELTRKCNLSCPHCYIDAGKARAAEMSTSRWLELIDEMAAVGVWAIAFTGGEPTLHPGFAEIVCHARSRDLLVGIATHGMFLSEELLGSLPREGVIISVSIDDLHTGPREKSFPAEQARAAILRAQRHGFLTNVMTNTHRRNIDGLADLMAWARSHGISVRSVPMSPIGRGKFNRYLENRVEDVETAAQFWLQECTWEHEFHEAAGICVGSIFNYGMSFAYMTRRCASGRYLCYVAADGTMFPCTMCAGEGLFPAGSVAERPFASVWRDHWPMRDFGWDDFADSCRGCPINNEAYYCASRCPAMSHARHGVLNRCGASPFEIESVRHRSVLIADTPTGQSSNRPVRPVSAPREPQG